VVTRTLGLVSGNSERRRGKLKAGIVGDIETPIVVKSGGFAGGEVAISDGQKIGDLFGAGPVLLEPPELEPIL